MKEKYSNIRENPSFKELSQMSELIEYFSNPNIYSNLSPEIKKAVETAQDTLKKKSYILNLPDKFNSFFSSMGWVAYSGMNVRVMEKTIALAEENKIQEAEEVILSYFNDNLDRFLKIFNTVPQMRPRMRLLEKAIEDHKEGRYYSAIPLMLMMVDGFVNDITPKGFFAKDNELTIWDSIVGHEKGLANLATILNKGTYKTKAETITLPYRNGILHGRELAYDNEYVSTKCIALLVYVVTWAKDKDTEEKRKAAFQEKNEQTLPEIIDVYRETQLQRELITEWKARNLEKIDFANFTPSDESPEKISYLFLESFQRENYYELGKHPSFLFTKGRTLKKLAGEMREMFSGLDLISFNLCRIVDTAPSISEVFFNTSYRSDFSGDKIRNKEIKFRLIYEDDTGNNWSRNTPGARGEWKIINVWDIYNQFIINK